MSVPMSLTLGLSGQPMSGADIGGFLFHADADLFGNWIALGAFLPFFLAVMLVPEPTIKSLGLWKRNRRGFPYCFGTQIYFATLLLYSFA